MGRHTTDIASRLVKPKDSHFIQCLELINHIEGKRLSEVSVALTSIVNDFRKGNRSTPRLALEDVSTDDILSIPRLSTQYEALLQPRDHV